MPKTRVITFGLVTALLTCLPALAASKSVAESRMVLDGSYPASERHVLVIPADIENDVNVCVGAAHDIKKAPNEGFNTAKITISRPDPETDEVSVEKHGKRGTLSGNKWLRCIITGPLAAGDTIEFDYVFSGYRKPRGATIHVRSTVGEGRMLISELRGAEAQGNTGEPTQFHQRVVSVFARNGKHPKVLQQGFVVHANSLGKVRFCVGYGNTIVKKPGDGSAVITADIGRNSC